jgi:transcriptional regulator with XRE-family HTH domain
MRDAGFGSTRSGMATHRDVQARIRKRIQDQLQDLRMTQRELAKSVGHDDAWISGILAGRHGLHWKDFDAVAEKLRLSPSELVRADDAELRELTPTELRLLKHFQAWPDHIQARWLEVLDFFSATSPDRDTAVLLTHLRDTPRSLRGPVMRWLERLLEVGIPPELVVDGAVPATGGGSTETTPKHRARQAGKTRGGSKPSR